MASFPRSQLADFRIALLLSGGNALGSYQGGAYEALEEQGIAPDWVAGASAGAINGAIICGNPADQRLAKLRELWRPTAGATAQPGGPWNGVDQARRTQAAAKTMMAGEPRLFIPRALYGPWWNPLGNTEPPSLYDASPLQRTIESLVDFDLLNEGTPRFSATAVDIETGEDLFFDTHRERVTSHHLRASSALLPVFSPVDVDGRLVGDAGISVNLPLDVVLCEQSDRPLICIAVDLLPLHGARPGTLGEVALRTQDLIFASQSRRAIAAWQAVFTERARHPGCASITLLHVAYSGQSQEVSGKAFDFSARSAAARWRAGYEDLSFALGELATRRQEIGRPGMTVYATTHGSDSRQLKAVEWRLGPKPAGSI